MEQNSKKSFRLGRSLLYLALCLAFLLFLGGCAQLTLEPSGLGMPVSSPGFSGQSSSVTVTPDADGRHVWIVSGTPHKGESNITYCTVPGEGAVPTCVMVAPQ